MADQTDAAGKDIRDNATVLTQWRKLQEIKRAMVRDGKCDGDATPAKVLEAIRAEIPPNLF